MHPKAIDLWDVFAVGCIGAGFWQALQAERRRSVEEHRRAAERRRQLEQMAWNNMFRHSPEPALRLFGAAFSAN